MRQQDRKMYIHACGCVVCDPIVLAEVRAAYLAGRDPSRAMAMSPLERASVGIRMFEGTLSWLEEREVAHREKAAWR